jgi:transcriptional regulator with XRE-family HTH domain
MSRKGVYFMLEFGENLKKIRESKEITQNNLSKITNIKQSTISKYETNVDKPSLDTLIKLALALNVTVDDLIDFKNIQHKLSKNYKEIK